MSFKANISLLIFFLDALSIDVSGVLNFSAIIVLLSISPFRFVNICFIYLDAPMLGVYKHLQMSFSCIDPFISYHYIMPFFVSYYSLGFKSILSDTNIAIPAFFLLPFVRNTFFYPFTFSLCLSLCLKCISCRQHIDRSCFFIHLATLYLLIGEFSPFTLNY